MENEQQLSRLEVVVKLKEILSMLNKEYNKEIASLTLYHQLRITEKYLDFLKELDSKLDFFEFQGVTKRMAEKDEYLKKVGEPLNLSFEKIIAFLKQEYPKSSKEIGKIIRMYYFIHLPLIMKQIYGKNKTINKSTSSLIKILQEDSDESCIQVGNYLKSESSLEFLAMTAVYAGVDFFSKKRKEVISKAECNEELVEKDYSSRKINEQRPSKTEKEQIVGFESYLADFQLKILFKELLGNFIAEDTIEENFIAVFKPSPIENFKPVEWIKKAKSKKLDKSSIFKLLSLAGIDTKEIDYNKVNFLFKTDSIKCSFGNNHGNKIREQSKNKMELVEIFSKL